MKRSRILFLAIFSMLGFLTSSMLLTILNNFNPSWSYFLTDNQDEQNSTCAMSEDGNFIVVGSGNDYLYLFEHNKPLPEWRYKMSDDVISVDISANGKYIVACDLASNVLLFQRNSSIPMQIYKGNPYMITYAEISANGNYIIIKSGETLCLYHRESLTTLWSTSIPSGTYPLIEISDDGSKIAASSDGILYYFEKESSSPLWCHDTQEIFITSLAISSGGEVIAMGGQNQRIDVFYNTNPTPYRSYKTSTTIRSLSISKDGSIIAAGCADGCYLFNIYNTTYIWRYGLRSDSSHLAISSDGNYIVGGDLFYGDVNNKIYCLMKDTNLPHWSIGVSGMINEVSISDTGDIIAVATQHYFYYLNRQNPNVFDLYQTIVNLTFAGYCVSAHLGIILGVWYVLKSFRINVFNEIMRFKQKRKFQRQFH